MMGCCVCRTPYKVSSTIQGIVPAWHSANVATQSAKDISTREECSLILSEGLASIHVKHPRNSRHIMRRPQRSDSCLDDGDRSFLIPARFESSDVI